LRDALPVHTAACPDESKAGIMATNVKELEGAFMARPAFSKDEFEVVGMYPGIERFAVVGTQITIPESPILNRPIPVRENWKLLLDGKKPYWIPSTGWIFCDQVQFRPRINPANVANHQILTAARALITTPLGRLCTAAGLTWTGSGNMRFPERP
jgi:hypothetical protein